MEGYRMNQISITFSAKLTIFFIALLLFIPLLTSWSTDHAERSKWEKRELAEWPEWRSSSDYFSQLSAYADDHIGLALELNQLYRKLMFYGFRDNPVANISVGKSGFVYLNSHNAKRTNTKFNTLCKDGVSNVFFNKRKEQFDRLFTLLKSRSFTTTIGIAISKPAAYSGEVERPFRRKMNTSQP